ncbi:MAG: DUF2163 domain-containing protein [Pseudomonadota bacterium]
MRDVPLALQASLDSGATTLARCWRVARTDGTVLGFTDHDLDLGFGGLVYESEAALAASALEAVTGLATDTHEITGALSSDRITEADIARGLYDGAEVTLYLVNWQAPADRLVLSRGQIGEIRRGDIAFEAEIVGLSDRLNQPFGRAFLHSCSCREGEVDLGINLSDPAYRAAATVATVNEVQQFSVAGLGAYENGWFTGGLLRWTSGANAGLEAHVKAHLAAEPESIVEIWLSPPEPVQAGDAFEITVGLSLTADQWKTKFGDLVDFRGFPHMPGDDVAASYPNSGGQHDGGSLFRTS